MNRNFFLLLALLLVFVPFTFAQEANVIPPPQVVIGTGNNPQENPPGINTPTVDFVQCPEGYNCLTVSDYETLFEEFKKFGETLATKNEFMDNIVERLDAKLTQSETERKVTLDIVKADQEQLKIKSQELAAATSQIDSLSKKVETLTTQIEIVKAQNVAMYMLILVLSLMSAYIFLRIQKHTKYILKAIIDWLPFKVS